MGFIEINGQRVHTSCLNPNPVIKIIQGDRWLRDDVEYTTLYYYYKNGEIETITQTINN